MRPTHVWQIVTKSMNVDEVNQMVKIGRSLRWTPNESLLLLYIGSSHRHSLTFNNFDIILRMMCEHLIQLNSSIDRSLCNVKHSRILLHSLFVIKNKPCTCCCLYTKFELWTSLYLDFHACKKKKTHNFHSEKER